MSKLLWYHKGSDTCFVTSVTVGRRPILDDFGDFLVDIINYYSDLMDFKVIAYVIMPDHFHAIFECNGNNLSMIMPLRSIMIVAGSLVIMYFFTKTVPFLSIRIG